MFPSDFWNFVLRRAIRTLAQTAIAVIGTGTLLSDIDWLAVLSASTLAACLSVLTSIVLGIPEENLPE